MNKENILKVIKELREKSQKRNFKQTFDIIITLSHLNLKKPENQLDVFQQLHFARGKPVKTCALVGAELFEQAKKICDMAIHSDDFEKYGKDKKATKKLASEYEYFIAQATIMPKVAAAFGRVLGPRGKMPNPKAGCVVPPNANLKPLVEKLQKTVRLSAKTSLMVQAYVGVEDMKDEELADNILNIYDAVIHNLPAGLNNLKKVLLKLTMGKPVQVEL
jgi:large subunit ribosomal protein L1